MLFWLLLYKGMDQPTVHIWQLLCYHSFVVFWLFHDLLKCFLHDLHLVSVISDHLYCHYSQFFVSKKSISSLILCYKFLPCFFACNTLSCFHIYLAYYVNGLFFPGCSIVVLTSSLCCEWIRLGQWLVCPWRGRDWQIYSCDHRWCFSLSYGTKSVGSFASMYGFSLTLDSPSMCDLTYVSVLIFLWYEASALNSIGFWVKLVFSFRWRPL